MTHHFRRLTHNKLALLALVCAVVLGSTVLFHRFRVSGPHAAEISAVGHYGELPPVW